MQKGTAFSDCPDFQKTVKIDVYQGESYYVDENIYLGELSVDVPMALKGQESVTVCYTYDINGILVVDVKVDSTGQQARQVITTGKNTIDPEEMDHYLEALEQLKTPPADEEENQMLLACGERLFTQTTGRLREEIGKRIQYFQYLMNQEQNPYKVKKIRKNIADFFEHVDQYLDSFEDTWLNAEEDDGSWYEEEDDESWYEEEDDGSWYEERDVREESIK